MMDIKLGDIELAVEERISITGGGAVIQFVDSVTGLPKPVKLGREPLRFDLVVLFWDHNKDQLATLRKMYENGTVATFGYDDEGVKVIITDLSIDDYDDRIEVRMTLQEVDVESVITPGGG